MSNLSNRIKKAGNLIFVDTPGTKTKTGSTWGSNNDRYTVSLFRKRQSEVVQLVDTSINVSVISASCKKLDITNGELNPLVDCPGNCRHTVCYHSLGYLKSELAKQGEYISYYENIRSALNGLNFGGYLAKVVSKQGGGYVWAVIRDSKKILTAKENINLMRGSEDDEGID